jgi:hypothetical protein
MTTFQNFFTRPSKRGQRCCLVVISPPFNPGKWYGAENWLGFSGHGKGNGE